MNKALFWLFVLICLATPPTYHYYLNGWFGPRSSEILEVNTQDKNIEFFYCTKLDGTYVYAEIKYCPPEKVEETRNICKEESRLALIEYKRIKKLIR